jgi:hypothetical protein
MTTKINQEGIFTEGTLIVPDSPEWHEWLETAKSFRFEMIHDETFIARCVPEIKTLTFSGVKVSGYWQAHKKVDGTLRREYLGKALYYSKLKEVALFINSDNYWCQRKRLPKQVSSKPYKKSEYEKANETFCSSENEIAKLKARIAELENQEEKLLNFQTQIMCLQYENAKLKQKFEGPPEPEREMRQEINRLMRLELENNSLKAWNQELKERLEANPQPNNSNL